MTEREKAMEELKRVAEMVRPPGFEKTESALRFALSDMEAMAKMEAHGWSWSPELGSFFRVGDKGRVILGAEVSR